MSTYNAVQTSFADGEVDLKKLYKELTKKQKAAVDALEKLLTREGVDDKIVLGAAKSLIELAADVENKINTDQLNRLIASVKLGNGNQGRLVEEKQRPLVDFTTIREI